MYMELDALLPFTLPTAGLRRHINTIAHRDGIAGLYSILKKDVQLGYSLIIALKVLKW